MELKIAGEGEDDNGKKKKKEKKRRKSGLIFKNSLRFTDCVSEINNAQMDNAKDTDATIHKQ